MRPTKRHFLEVSAAIANAAETEDLSDFTEYEKMCRILGLQGRYLPAQANKITF